MKKSIFLPALFVIATTGCNKESVQAAPAAPASKTPTTLEEKQAYAVGARMAQSHKQVIDDVSKVQGSFDVDMYMMGIADTIKGESKFSEEELKSISDAFRSDYLAKKREIVEKQKAEAKKVAEEFLTANKEKEGVITTESGLQYKILEAGGGKQPEDGFKVKVLYTGKLINGEVFDTTDPSKEPRIFELNRLVRGWQEGLKLMKEGAKFEFYVPPDLGYGNRDTEKIPQGSVLIFEVELLETYKPSPADALKDMPPGHP